MNKEKLEKDYYADRPTEPYSDDDNPNDWANIAHYAEENLEKAFKRIAELEKQLEKLPDKWCRNEEDYCPHLAKLEKENAELKARLNAINILTPELQKISRRKDKQLTKAKRSISRLLKIIKDSSIYITGYYEHRDWITEAEQFIKYIEVESD